ncbi:signal peptidase I [Pseudobacteroides cellulosolvens]|uniref:Signal peptidase I n=1 Tax=Pseudobacteroides cellulosolvens ATCC 35603 = DSM 2933 TaxID=398512 RepID=A0A0L6JI67_9FIRM|nr:signal peptidase I [Pseudobacteroides cellulosolvens]KNY25546.1 peptidase S26B, signal peptidase [Pseudobacteroides cellulosolvens ATCC 35603 = DSM 2933]
MHWSRKNFELITIILLLIFIYFIDNFQLSSVRSSPVYLYFGKPLLWFTCAAVVLFTFTTKRPMGKLRIKTDIILFGVVISFFYIMLQVMGGFIDGFGKSPYSFTIIGLAGNTWILLTSLLCKELIRQNIMGHFYHRKNFYIPIFITSLVMTLMEIQISQVSTIDTNLKAVNFIGSTLLPIFCENVLASYLSYLAGFKASLGFIGIQKAFHWYCPILPNLSFITKSLLGVFVPFLAIILIQHLYLKHIRIKENRMVKSKNPFSWTVACVLSVIIVWFTVGIFPVYPSIIATGSMIPICYPGDMVIYQKIKIKDICKGDIIHFTCKDKVTVTHRVTEIIKSDKTVYRTKGDNNSIPDIDLVYPEQIKGKVLFVIPKLGWISMLLKSHGEKSGKFEY